MTSRKLSLRRERLTELVTSELESVNGASGLPCNPNIESLLPTCGCTGQWPTFNCTQG